MQSKENSTTDARTFPEIWKSLTQYEQRNLRADIVHATKCTTVTIYRWQTGENTPSSQPAKDKVAQVVSKFLGRKCFAHTLFPNK